MSQLSEAEELELMELELERQSSTPDQPQDQTAPTDPFAKFGDVDERYQTHVRNLAAQGEEMVPGVGVIHVGKPPDLLGQLGGLFGGPLRMAQGLLAQAQDIGRMDEPLEQKLMRYGQGIAEAPGNIAGKYLYGSSKDRAEIVGDVATGVASARLPQLVGAASETLTAWQNAMPMRNRNIALNRITKALNVQPEEASRYLMTLDEAMPHIYDYANKQGRKWDSLKGFGNSADDAAAQYIKDNYNTVSGPFKDMHLSGDELANAARSVKGSLRPDQVQLAKSIDKFADNYAGRNVPLGEMEDIRRSFNDKLEAGAKAQGLTVEELAAANPMSAAERAVQQASRNSINRAIDTIGNRYPGATAGVLRVYRSMLDVAERAKSLAPKVQVSEMTRKGERWGVERGLDQAARAIGLRSANPAAAVGSQMLGGITRGKNRPDRLIASARKVLDESKGGTALAQPIGPKTMAPRKALPAAGDLSISDRQFIQPTAQSKKVAKRKLLGTGADPATGTAQGFEESTTGQYGGMTDTERAAEAFRTAPNVITVRSPKLLNPAQRTRGTMTPSIIPNTGETLFNLRDWGGKPRGSMFTGQKPVQRKIIVGPVPKTPKMSLPTGVTHKGPWEGIGEMYDVDTPKGATSILVQPGEDLLTKVQETRRKFGMPEGE